MKAAEEFAMPPSKKVVAKTPPAAKAQSTLPTRTIKQSVLIPATPVEVYDAMVNARKHAAFTGVPAKSVNKVGGKFTAWDGYIIGKYLKLVPGKKIVEEWSTSDWPAGYAPSLIELTFERANAVTRLTMVQTEVPAAQAPQYRQGWKDYYWTPLKSYFIAKRKASGKSPTLR
jgi:activator of HSP90 ATPase